MAPKRVLILGATGGTGRQVVEQAIAAGVDVTVVVRDPAKLSTAARSIRVFTGDLLRNTSVLAGAVAGQDAVISTLGVGRPSRRRASFAQPPRPSSERCTSRV